jgi:isoquinoline 1-oxidoreductase beta subunit
MPNRFRSSRRNFLKVSTAVGGGLALEVAPPALAQDFTNGKAARPPAGPELTAWIVIRPNDEVLIGVARSEMGQGSSTGLPMLVAEELECESIHASQGYLRRVATREMLIAGATVSWAPATIAT